MYVIFYVIIYLTSSSLLSYKLFINLIAYLYFCPTAFPVPRRCLYLWDRRERRKKSMNICESPQSSFYNEGLLPPNAFALCNRKKSCTKENFLNLSRFYILSRKFIWIFTPSLANMSQSHTLRKKSEKILRTAG